jgi:chromosomal replication initiator protein
MFASNRDNERSWAHEYLGAHVAVLPPRPRPPSSIFVLEHVALMHRLTAAELLATRRYDIVVARQVAMYLSRALTHESFPQIARNFRKSDHTTVMYACRKIADRVERDSRFSEEITYLRSLIEDSHRAYLEHSDARRAS